MIPTSVPSIVIPQLMIFPTFSITAQNDHQYALSHFNSFIVLDIQHILFTQNPNLILSTLNIFNHSGYLI